MWEMKFLPPGRGLWAMGTDMVYEKGGACLNNCAFVSTENLATNFTDPFVFMMDMSMMGAGVGFDVEGAGKVSVAGVAKGMSMQHRISDDREGWCEALRALLESYIRGTAKCDFNYDEIREKGALIKGFGGTSSGAGPLKRLLDEDIPEIMSRYLGKCLDEAGIADIFNAIGRCVVAGNVRRSAQIALGPQSSEFIALKTPGAERLKKWGWASNNTVVVRNGGSVEEECIDATKDNGEPGYFWLDNARRYGRMGWGNDGRERDADVAGTNPCSEQSLESFEMCCLVETFPARHKDYEEYQRTLKYAYLYAKTVTLVPTHFPQTNAVMMRNRRIGTSMSGIIQAMNKFGRKEFFEKWCDGGYQYLRELDKVYSRWLCIPASIKLSSVKPSGSVSLLPGVTPGIHHAHSRYYLRRIRFDKDSPLVVKLKGSGYVVEKDVVDDHAVVVSFPVEETHFERSKVEVSMWEQLEIAAQMQHWWADNQVSVTVTFKQSEKCDIKNSLEMYSNRLKAVSFLPLSEHGYEQAPYEEITSAKYAEYIAEISKFRLSKKLDLNEERGGSGCDGDRCVL